MTTLIVGTNGDVRMLYDDAWARFMRSLGECVVRRASHVEPSGTKWVADMSPVGGPVFGPFSERRIALGVERLYLLRHRIPRTKTPADKIYTKYVPDDGKRNELKW